MPHPSPAIRRARAVERVNAHRLGRRSSGLCIACPVGPDVKRATRGQLCDECADVAATKQAAHREAPLPDVRRAFRAPTEGEREAIIDEFSRPAADGWTYVRPLPARGAP